MAGFPLDVVLFIKGYSGWSKGGLVGVDGKGLYSFIASVDVRNKTSVKIKINHHKKITGDEKSHFTSH